MSDPSTELESYNHDALPLHVKIEVDEQENSVEEEEEEEMTTTSSAPAGEAEDAAEEEIEEEEDEAEPSLNNNNNNAKLDKRYQCTECVSAFSRRSDLMRHTRVHNGLKPFKCDCCGKEFALKSVLKSHLLKHSGELPYRCEECGDAFSRRHVLENHARVHTGEKPYKCDICDRKFSQKGTLHQHIRLHTGDRPYKCPFCKAAFIKPSYLKMHNCKQVSEELPTPLPQSVGAAYPCEQCGAGFARKRDLQLHGRVHIKTTPIVCEFCGATFRHQTNLQTHRLKHTAEQQRLLLAMKAKLAAEAEAEAAAAITPKSESVDVDVNTTPDPAAPPKKPSRYRGVKVTGLRPFKCTECGAGFSEKHVLANHARVHTGEKPFKCDICGSTFSQKGTLHQHIRLHTGDKPHKCDLCGAAFIKPSYLKIHRRVHFGENPRVSDVPYRCNVCDVAFARKGDLTRHVRVHGSPADGNTTDSAGNAVEGNGVDSIVTGANVDDNITDTNLIPDPSISEFCANALSLRPELNHSTFPIVQRRLKQKNHKCPKCEVAFSRRSDLKRHARLHINDADTSASEFCDTTLGENNEFQVPTVVAPPSPSVNSRKPAVLKSGERPHKCTKCAAAFARRADLKRHGRVHNNENLSISEFCETTFMQKPDLVTTENNTQMQEPKCEVLPYKCIICDVGFAQMLDLQRHELTHADDPLPPLPGRVGVAVTQNVDVRVNRPQDLVARPFKCDECGAAFTRKHVLENHARVHSGDKPFKCAVCGISFSQRGTLHQHVRLHTGDKPHKCHICGAAFIKPSYLKSHLAVHSGERPYKCKQCNLAFLRKSDMQKHRCTHGVEQAA